MKLVSACLAGIPCRYDCKSQEREFIRSWVEKGEALPLCPEELGGLPTPRPPSEKQGDLFVNIHGEDVTSNYLQGASRALEIAKSAHCTSAYLKSRSPMCGVTQIYDGSFQGKLTKGHGALVALLLSEGFEVHSVD